jgi:response regulator NasT
MNGTPGSGPKQALRILVVRDQSGEHALQTRAIHKGLLNTGYELTQIVDADMDLPDRIAELAPDMVIIASESAARDTIEHVCVATRSDPRPIVLFTDNSDPGTMRTALSAGITTYIVDGLRAERIKPVLDVAALRFEFEQQLRRELEQTRDKLSERKVVERAKGVLMKQLAIDEPEAYRRLRKVAMDKGLRLAEVAQRIIDVSSALG